MGILLSVCGLSQLACCATSTACNCLGCIAPSIGGRLMYAVMLFLVTVTGWIMMLPNVSNWLQSKVPFCWKKMSISVMSFIGKSSEKEPEPTICEKATGYLAVYRLMFGTFLFFIFFGFIMIKIQSKRDPRIALHRGFWLIKFIMLVSIIFGSFYIPDTGSFGSIWQNFGFIGSFLFLMIQVCFLILFADDLAASWNRMTSSDGIHFLLPLVSLINYVASVVGLALFYSYYGGSGCALHNWMISINLILIILITFTAISPKVQEYYTGSGLLQSSILSIYITYMTWSALNSSPNANCKPILWSQSPDKTDWQSFIALLICFVCVIYSSIRLSTKAGIERISGAPLEIDQESNEDQNLEEDENYSHWPFFYWLFALATLYLMMTMTNWFTPNEQYKHFDESASSLWIKMISSWFSALIYLWILVAPVLLHDYRDFS